MDVWLLGTGQYSDFQIRAVFSSQELAAQAVADLAERDDDEEIVYDWIPTIQRYTVMEHRARTAYTIATIFHLTGSRQDGREGEPGPNSWVHRLYEIPEWEMSKPPAPVAVSVNKDSYDRYYELRVEGLDKERVLKTFGDRRAQILALPWITMSRDEIEAALTPVRP